MYVFKKICFICGAKEENLFEGKCEKCFSNEFPPIQEIKQIKLRICNTCKKIHYKNGLFTLEEIEKMLPIIVQKNLILNEHYNLKFLKIEDFKLTGNKIFFEIVIDCDLKI